MLEHWLYKQEHMTLPPQVPMTSCSRPELGLSRVQFPGTPREMLYQSPLIFIKVKSYYAFNGGGHANLSGAHVSIWWPLLPPALQPGPGWEARSAFFPCQVLERRSSFSSAGPSPFPSPIFFGTRGTERLPLGGGARTVAGFPTAGGQEPAALTGLLHAQHHPSCQAQGRSGGQKAGSHPQGRNVAAHPLWFSAPPAHPPPKVLQTRTSFSSLEFRARDSPRSSFQASLIYQEGQRGQFKQAANNTKVGEQLSARSKGVHVCAGMCFCAVTAFSSQSHGKVPPSLLHPEEERAPGRAPPAPAPCFQGRAGPAAPLPLAAGCVSCSGPHDPPEADMEELRRSISAFASAWMAFSVTQEGGNEASFSRPAK